METVEHILNVFEDRNFVKLVKTLGSFNQVLRWNPSLKRWLEEQT